MPRVVIDNREVDVPAGSALLDAARKLGIDVPSLCYLDGLRPNTTCMVCLMKVKDPDRLAPSCATVVEDGMRIESETEQVRHIRRTALELLLSDHAGECRAPCQYACPFDTDVPRMIRQIGAGRIEDAIVTIRTDIPLAAVLSRVGQERCECACRRRAVDEPVAIALLKRYVADKDLASPAPYIPPCRESSGKRVAIVGAGPAGLSAAYFLLRQGHACTLIDSREEPGGSLRSFIEEPLPRDVIDGEIAIIEKLGARFEVNTTVSRRRQGGESRASHAFQRTLDELRQDYDAVLVAIGRLDGRAADALGLAAAEGRLQANRTTHETGQPGVFAAGDAIRPSGQAERAAADGKAAAHCIDQHLRCGSVTGPRRLTVLKTGRPRAEEIAAMAADASPADRVTPCGNSSVGLTDEEARAEARRCLHCDCEKLDACRLRKYAEMYGANASRFRGRRRSFERRLHHPDIVYEPGKCILCGLCIQIAEQAGEPLGLTFVGRGFDVRVAVPFDESLPKALKVAARRCAEACPTGALVLRAGRAYDVCRNEC